MTAPFSFQAPPALRTRAMAVRAFGLAAFALLTACEGGPLGSGAPTTVGLGATSNVLQDGGLEGTIQRDAVLPFSQVFLQAGSAGQDITVAGEVQDRVMSLNDDGTLVFAPRLRNMTSSPPVGNTIAIVESFTLSGYRGVDVEVFYRSDSSGTVAPATVTRSADGDRLTFTFSLMEDRTALGSIQGADFPDTKFLSIETDATGFTTDGTMTINATTQSFNGGRDETITVTGVAAPVTP